MKTIESWCKFLSEFDETMIRKFKPIYYYKAFKEIDIDEIDKIIDYARGLVIKDEDIAQSYETNESMREAEQYMASKDRDVESFYTPYEEYVIIKNYKEKNKYYNNLKVVYNIDSYHSRKAKDYEVIKSLNKTLSVSEENLFLEAYKEALEYFKNVTYTPAFKNQPYERQMYNMYIINSTIHRYINKIFYGYFDVDTYGKERLKNGFISWGMDYFDDFPIEYQRRVYKSLNDMIRKKGSNDVFNLISSIFSLDSIDINKYFLAKKENNLAFFKTNINNRLNIATDTEVRYDTIVDNDPYWRSSKEDIINKPFNVIETKYISVDAVINITNNSTNLAYLYSLLRQLKQNGLDIDSTFSFRNSNISDTSINLYDAIIALNVLILKRVGWTDKISSKTSNGISFNFDTDVKSTLKDIKTYIYKNKYTIDNYNEILKFLSRINIKDITNENFITVDEILDEYYKSDVIKDQFTFIGEILRGVNGSDELLYYIEEDLIYDGMVYLWKQIVIPERKFEYKSVSYYKDFMQVFNKFIGHQIANGEITEDDIYNFMINESSIMNELDVYIRMLEDDSLTNKYEIFLHTKSISNIKAVLLEMEQVINNLISENNYPEWKQLDKYQILKSFLMDILSYSRYNTDSVTINDFMSILEYNNDMRRELEEFTYNVDDGRLKIKLRELWEQIFISDTYNSLFDGYSTYSDYLKDNNPGLYYYTIVESNIYDHDSFNHDKVYRDKIFDLVNSIDNHLNLDEDLFVNNNFIGILGFIKNYIQILVTVFKSYTADIVNTELLYKFDSKFDNGIDLTDDLYIGKVELQQSDSINIMDRFEINAE